MARRPTSQQRQINAALARLEPEVARAFQAAIVAARGQVNMGHLIAALDAGDLGAAVRLLTFPQALMFPLEDAIRTSYIQGGNMIAASAPSALIAFGGNSPGATAWLQNHSATLIQGIYDETLAATRQALVAGREAGMGSRAIARDIVGRVVGGQRQGGILGLTTQQADSIISARGKLASGDPKLMREYFRLELRNKRFDAEIRRAIADGKPITGARLDAILEAHKSKALAYRGKVIAKDQTFQALEAGRAEAIAQALENPEVEGAFCRWQHNLSENPREDHQEMDGKTVEYGETFELPDGSRMLHPHDPAGGPQNNAGCQCIGIWRIRMRT